MRSFRIIVVAACTFLACFCNQHAFASGSGGYRDETPDAGAMGEGSAFVGEADTPASVYYNPAGMNQISVPEVTLGGADIDPREQYTNTSGDTTHANVNEYLVPNFYAVVPIIANKLTVGVAGGSYWGLGENWGTNSNLQYAVTQATLQNIDNSLAVAYQVTNQWSLAASLDNDYSRADESYNFPNPGQSPGGVELKATNDSIGYRLATMFKINDQNQVGLMYRSRMDEDYDGKVYVSNIGSYFQSAIPGIGSSFVTKAEEKSVLPQSVVMGYSFKPTTKWTINADVEWMDWSSTKYEILTFPNATPQQAAFLGSTPTPEDWHSAWSESIGTQYALTDRFRVRLGYYHHERVSPTADFDPIILDSNSNGYTTGFGFDITKRLTLDVAYTFAIYDTRDITNSVLADEGETVNGKYSEYLNIGMVDLTYKF